jgi:hypothetical protein
MYPCFLVNSTMALSSRLATDFELIRPYLEGDLAWIQAWQGVGEFMLADEQSSSGEKFGFGQGSGSIESSEAVEQEESVEGSGSGEEFWDECWWLV